jgi:hypothetical protein
MAHSQEVKAQVMAALLAGQGVGEIAEQYSLPKSTVSTWKAELGDAQSEQIRTKKSERLDELIYEYLAANLAALREQVEVASDPAYIKRQSADNLAVLHGVMADKAIRILDAAERAGATAQQPEQE